MNIVNESSLQESLKEKTFIGPCPGIDQYRITQEQDPIITCDSPFEEIYLYIKEELIVILPAADRG